MATRAPWFSGIPTAGKSSLAAPPPTFLASDAGVESGGRGAGWALQARPGRKDFGVLYGSCAFQRAERRFSPRLLSRYRAPPCLQPRQPTTVNDGYLVAHVMARNLEQTRACASCAAALSACLDRNGRYLAAGTSTGQVLLIEAETLQIVRETSAHPGVTDVRALGGGDVLSCGYDNVCALSLFGHQLLQRCVSIPSVSGWTSTSNCLTAVLGAR